jgi:hypothetical protein
MPKMDITIPLKDLDRRIQAVEYAAAICGRLTLHSANVWKPQAV